MEILLNISAMIAAFFFFFFVEWGAHRYVMHGFLWFLHEDHHNRRNTPFQKNDSFALIFAIPSMLLIIFGIAEGISVMVSFGIGIAVYGLAYFLIHDVLIHRRFRNLRKLLFSNADNNYFRAIQKAHRAHHKHLTKEDGESFGMLIVAKKYFD